MTNDALLNLSICAHSIRTSELSDVRDALVAAETATDPMKSKDALMCARTRTLDLLREIDDVLAVKSWP